MNSELYSDTGRLGSTQHRTSPSGARRAVLLLFVWILSPRAHIVDILANTCGAAFDLCSNVGFGTSTSGLAFAARPLRVVRDAHLVTWHEYFDVKSQRFYYYQPVDKTTRWTIEFSRSVSNRVPANIIDLSGVRAVLREPLVRKRSSHISEHIKSTSRAGQNNTNAFVNPFRDPVSVAYASAQDTLPADFEALSLQDAPSDLSDPAGRLRLVHMWSPVDNLEGVRFARKSFNMLLRPTSILVLRFVDAVQVLYSTMPEVCAKFPSGNCSRAAIAEKYFKFGDLLAVTRSAIETALLEDTNPAVRNTKTTQQMEVERAKHICAFVGITGEPIDGVDIAACEALQSKDTATTSTITTTSTSTSTATDGIPRLPSVILPTTTPPPTPVHEAVADGSLWNLLGDVWLVIHIHYICVCIIY